MDEYGYTHQMQLQNIAPHTVISIPMAGSGIFKCSFLKWLVYFYLCSPPSKGKQVTIGSGNYLVPVRYQ